MYAFSDVAPWSAQKRTCRRASSVFVIACICRNVLVPFTYGAVASIAGPAISPAAVRRLTLMSMIPFTFPAVLIVVTPPARYSREKLTPSCP